MRASAPNHNVIPEQAQETPTPKNLLVLLLYNHSHTAFRKKAPVCCPPYRASFPTLGIILTLVQLGGSTSHRVQFLVPKVTQKARRLGRKPGKRRGEICKIPYFPPKRESHSDIHLEIHSGQTWRSWNRDWSSQLHDEVSRCHCWQCRHSRWSKTSFSLSRSQASPIYTCPIGRPATEVSYTLTSMNYVVWRFRPNSNKYFNIFQGKTAFLKPRTLRQSLSSNRPSPNPSLPKVHREAPLLPLGSPNVPGERHGEASGVVGSGGKKRTSSNLRVYETTKKTIGSSKWAWKIRKTNILRSTSPDIDITHGPSLVGSLECAWWHFHSPSKSSPESHKTGRMSFLSGFWITKNLRALSLVWKTSLAFCSLDALWVDKASSLIWGVPRTRKVRGCHC